MKFKKKLKNNLAFPINSSVRRLPLLSSGQRLGEFYMRTDEIVIGQFSPKETYKSRFFSITWNKIN